MEWVICVYKYVVHSVTSISSSFPDTVSNYIWFTLCTQSSKVTIKSKALPLRLGLSIVQNVLILMFWDLSFSTNANTFGTQPCSLKHLFYNVLSIVLCTCRVITLCMCCNRRKGRSRQRLKTRGGSWMTTDGNCSISRYTNAHLHMHTLFVLYFWKTVLV